MNSNWSCIKFSKNILTGAGFTFQPPAISGPLSLGLCSIWPAPGTGDGVALCQVLLAPLLFMLLSTALAPVTPHRAFSCRSRHSTPNAMRASKPVSAASPSHPNGAFISTCHLGVMHDSLLGYKQQILKSVVKLLLCSKQLTERLSK